MTLGTKLTAYLLVGVLAVLGLDVYLNLNRMRTNLLHDVRSEVAAVGRTLQVALHITGNDTPQRYFNQFASGVSGFEKVLGLVFYDGDGHIAAISASLQGHQLPEVDARHVIQTRMAIEGFFREGSTRRYYRVEPLLGSTGAGIAAFLIVEDFPLFTRELRQRALQMVLITLLVLMVLAVIVSVVIRQSVTRPLRAFASQLEHLGRGQFSHRLHFNRRDEIGRLAQEFDRMCDKLEEAQQKLIAESEEKLRLERALHHSEKLAALGQLASRLAHEIGTPLNVIQGRAEQLLHRETLTEKDQTFLHVIVTQSERISGFIRQLLTLARRSEPQFRSVQINEIVGRVRDLIEDRNRDVEIGVALADYLPPILGDPDQLQQVLLNLTVNALQAVGTGGRVTLGTRCGPNGSLQPSRVVEVVITDTGPGIPSQDLPHIFDPFFTTRGMVGGTGLGLAICREIVLSHRGEIRVESALGQGTRFIVSLPQSTEQDHRHTAGVLAGVEDHHGNGKA